MSEFDIIAQYGQKKLSFLKDFPKNVEIALHSVYYEQDFFNITQNAFLKIELIFSKNKNSEIILHLPPGFYNSFLIFKELLYLNAKKLVNNINRKYILIFINRMKLHNNILSFMFKKGITYRMSGDLSVCKFLGFGANKFIIVKETGISDRLLPINIKLKQEFAFECDELKYHQISHQILRYVPYKKAQHVRQIIKFKNLEYRQIDFRFLNNLNFNWPEDIKVYYFIIKVRLTK